MDLNDENHAHQIIGNEFDMKLYQSIEKIFKEKVDEVFNYFFNRDIGYKLLSVDENEVSFLKSSIIEVAIVDIVNGDKVLNLVLKFNEGRYQKKI